MDPRVARCHLLAEVLAADGIMTDEERSLLEERLARYQLSEPERDQVRHFEGGAGAAAAARALPEDQRQAIVDELVEAALADGKLSGKETAAIDRIVQAMGLGR
jgi:uncharacterized tellurite resistance protein B-like protein